MVAIAAAVADRWDSANARVRGQCIQRIFQRPKDPLRHYSTINGSIGQRLVLINLDGLAGVHSFRFAAF
jgi:hypothetical protein